MSNVTYLICETYYIKRDFMYSKMNVGNVGYEIGQMWERYLCKIKTNYLRRYEFLS